MRFVDLLMCDTLMQRGASLREACLTASRWSWTTDRREVRLELKLKSLPSRVSWSICRFLPRFGVGIQATKMVLRYPVFWQQRWGCFSLNYPPTQITLRLDDLDEPGERNVFHWGFAKRHALAHHPWGWCLCQHSTLVLFPGGSCFAGRPSGDVCSCSLQVIL